MNWKFWSKKDSKTEETTKETIANETEPKADKK